MLLNRSKTGLDVLTFYALDALLLDLWSPWVSWLLGLDVLVGL